MALHPPGERRLFFTWEILICVGAIKELHSIIRANTPSLWSRQRNHGTQMMLYKSTEEKVRSLDGDTNFFDIVAGVLQMDT